MKKLIKGLLVIIVAYILTCVFIYSFPQYIYYSPTNKTSDISKAVANGYKVTEVDYNSLDGTKLIGWYSKPTTRKEVILFLHGNSYNLETLYFKVMPLAKAGYGTLMAEYRGFGNLKGKISQEKLTEDSIAAVEYLYSLGYKNEDIILYGFSLGTYMATKVAFELQKDGEFNALVLESPFDNLVNVVHNKVPIIPSFAIRDQYDTASIINYIDSRILIMTGSDDTLVPSSLSQSLYYHAEHPKSFKMYIGAKHDDLFDYGNDDYILEWLENGEAEE